ncbi:MAG: AraC family transcriptional regulator [Flavobacterium sp.]|nr:MAG: AraC family transcriptional regulator [Flavobacterium sp.]
MFKYNFSLLHVDYVKLNHKWDYHNIVSPYYRIYFIDEGEGWLSDKNTKLKMEPGFIYIIPSFTLCSITCEEYLSQYFMHFLEESADGKSLFANNRALVKVKASDTDLQNFKRLLTINPGRGINRSNNPKVYEKDEYYKSDLELNNFQSLAKQMETNGIIFQLLSRFLTSSTFKETATNSIPSKILGAMSFIQLNLANDLSVKHLAARSNLHIDYFSRLFLQYTGSRPITYVNEKRIERAQYLMVTSNASFEEIAYATGFETVSYFFRIFKKTTGLSPGKYKNQNKITVV